MAIVAATVATIEINNEKNVPQKGINKEIEKIAPLEIAIHLYFLTTITLSRGVNFWRSFIKSMNEKP